ncbi:HDOD domain-containing protein [Variovorax sp. HJSM1_2]|uniref:HDOD domain-containing protein n=1 Tax=Variovorax sp. HJSM1_2 TaxID=3366263 RepID=UPI003BE794AD
MLEHPVATSVPQAVPAAAPVVSRVPALAPAARRPLMAPSGEVVGFEFHVTPDVLRKVAGDATLQAAHMAMLLVSARLVSMGGRVGLAQVPAAWLACATVPQDESGTLIGLVFDSAEPLTPEVQSGLVAAIDQFRRVGAQLAWEAAYDLGSMPDYLLLRPAAGQTAQALLQILQTRLPAQQALPVIATDLGSVEDLEWVLRNGVRLASGQLQETKPRLNPAGELAPEVGRLARLVALLSSDAELDEIVGVIKGDISISVKLLQRMSGASFVHLGTVTSIERAVQLLGRKELHRWLSSMLMQFAQKRTLSSALQEVALWRARLLELLAIERGESDSGRFFTLGLGSMLGVILKIPPAEVAKILSLSPEATQALLAQAGPCWAYLRIAKQVESQTLADADTVAEGFGHAARVLALSDEAWQWAAQHSGQGAGAGAPKTMAEPA